MKIFTNSIFRTVLSSVALSLFALTASAQCDPPAAPVTISNIQSTSADASWGASPDEVSGGQYFWEIRTTGDPGSGAVGLHEGGFTANGILNITINDLDFDETYYFYVSYECSTGNQSTWVEAEQSPFATSTLQPPTATPATNVEDVSMRVNWTVVPGADLYLLDVSTSPTFATFFDDYESSPTTNNFAQLTGLTANTTYYWRVRSVGTGGEGATTSTYSNTMERTTLGPQEDWVIWQFNPDTQAGHWVPSVSEGPDSSMDVIINYEYNTTPNGSFVCKNLQINAGHTLTINPLDNVRVLNVVTNLNPNNEGLVIESNGMLIQTHTNLSGNTGGAMVERASSPIYRLDYTMWSSPTSGDGNVSNGQTLLQFSPETVSTRFYSYETETDFFTAISPSQQFEPGRGYLIRAPNNYTSYDVDNPVPGTSWLGTFWGTLNSGNISVPLDLSGDRFNMVGNPYPSLISIEEFLLGNTGLESTIYFWRRRNNDSGDDNGTTAAYYATYTSAGGVGVPTTNPSTGSSLEPDGNIQVGQGFIVQAKSTTVAPATVNFTNAMRNIEAPEDPFFRSANAKANVEDRHRFWLNVSNSSKMYNKMLVAYMPTGQNGLDASDGKSYGESSVALTSFLDANEYTIQGRAPFVATDIVPLNFRSEFADTFIISLDHLDGLFEGDQVILLRDNVTGIVHNLKSGDYTFASAAGTFSERFEVLYQTPLNTNDSVLNADGIVVFKQNGSIAINAGMTVMSSVKVFDIRGSLVAEKNNINASETSINPGVTNQVLIIQITTEDNRTVSKKFIN